LLLSECCRCYDKCQLDKREAVATGAIDFIDASAEAGSLLRTTGVSNTGKQRMSSDKGESLVSGGAAVCCAAH